MASCKDNKSYPSINSVISSDDVPLITADELDSLFRAGQAFNLYDTRSLEEYEVSHLPGAVWVGEKDTVPGPATDPGITVMYCSVGYRSGKAGERMIEKGYNEVYNLSGGIFHWVNTGRNVVNGRGGTTDSLHGYSPVWAVWLKKGTIVYE